MFRNYRISVSASLYLIIILFSAPSLCQIKTLKSFKFDPYGFIDSSYYDTSFSSIHRYNPIYFEYPSSTFLGSLGSASVNNFFIARNQSDFLFLNPYQQYLHFANNQNFYKTKTPFTEFRFSNSTSSRSKLEETLNLFHTQNINPFLNFGFDYDMLYDKGQYTSNLANNKSIRSKINSITVFTNYSKNNFLSYLSVTYNKIGPFDEFGGVTDDKLITDTVLQTEYISGKLKNTKSILRDRSILFYSEYKFGNKPTSDTSFINDTNTFVQKPFAIAIKSYFNDDYRIYSENENSYYTTYFYNKNFTYDSINLFSFKNSIILKKNQQTKILPNLRFSIASNLEFCKYYNNAPIDTLVIYKQNDTIRKNNNYLIFFNNDTSFVNYFNTSNLSFSSSFAYFFDSISNFAFNFEYFLSGYKKNSLLFNINFTHRFKMFNDIFQLNLNFKSNNLTANYYYNSYNSNHYIWHHNFGKTNYNIISAELKNLKYNIYSNFSIANINNYIYFNKNAMPDSYDHIFLISLHSKLNLRLWHFHFDNNFTLQKTNAPDSILSLPLFSILQSTYFQLIVVKNVLNLNIGFDLYYDTKYFAPAYEPSIGQFYNQNEKNLGNYPFFDIFANAKWKRTRLFAKYEHINSGLQFFSRNYFSALHYPRNVRMLKVGIAWNFYD